MCVSSTDSPFSNGQGNDYLFVGNMVYTVSFLLFCVVFSVCFINSVLFGMHMYIFYVLISSV